MSTPRHGLHNNLFTTDPQSDSSARVKVESVLSDEYSVGYDVAGRARVSQLTTLFDGRIMGAEDSTKFDTKGTGTAAYSASDNSVSLTVASNQYLVRQGRVFCPYFSGKPQLVEETCFNFNIQAGVIKRVGYFSSSAVAPYSASLDGAWVEANGDTNERRLITSNDGIVTHSILFSEMDNYSAVANYDWSKFTVQKIDFLWLGGAALRFFMVIDGKFTLLHTIDDHAGYATTTITKSPNQPVRYEIRSTGGTGTLKATCSQVATEGASVSEQGKGLAIYTPSIACNVIGTIYALAGVRKVAANRNRFIPVTEFGATNILTTATPESGVLLLMRNPTLSAPLSYSGNSLIETAVATTQTVTNPGRILKAVPMSGANVSAQAPSAALRVLSSGIDDAMDELVIGYVPLTTTQNVSGMIQVVEY